MLALRCSSITTLASACILDNYQNPTHSYSILRRLLSSQVPEAVLASYSAQPCSAGRVTGVQLGLRSPVMQFATYKKK